MLHVVRTPANREVARRNATAVASAIGGKALPYRKVTIGEPECPFEVRWNSSDFWFGIQISDSAFVVRGNHKRRFSVDIGFYASLSKPDPTMLAVIHLKALSMDLGVDVFVSEERFGPIVCSALRLEQIRALVAEIRFESVTRLFLSPVQIYGIAKCSAPENCVTQASLMRQLMLALFEWNKRRDA
jgi:hypothetical protein